MLNHLTLGGFTQPIYFFLGVRNGAEHIFKAHLQEMATQHPQVQLVVCYSAPAEADQIQRDYQQPGRVTAELINATNGYRVWSQSYDRQPKDIFQVQDGLDNDVPDNDVCDKHRQKCGDDPGRQQNRAVSAQLRIDRFQ